MKEKEMFIINSTKIYANVNCFAKYHDYFEELNI